MVYDMIYNYIKRKRDEKIHNCTRLKWQIADLQRQIELAEKKQAVKGAET